MKTKSCLNSIVTGVTAASLLVTGGCASIVSGGPKSLPVSSQPDDARCEVVETRTGNPILRGKTPFIATLEPDAGFFRNAKYRIRCEKQGYIPREVAVDAGLNPWYLGNVAFGGLIGILIVDPATGAMWKIHEDRVNVVLYPDDAAGKAELERVTAAERRRAEEDVSPADNRL